MSDHITVLRSIKGARLTKNWVYDPLLGTTEIEGYEDAKTFDASRLAIADLKQLHRALEQLAGEPSCCVIRGTYSSAHADRVHRNTESTVDTPHHWVMIDVDKWPWEPHDEEHPSEAAKFFVEQCLPSEFHDRDFIYQASASAGAPGTEGVLKAHLWFWLETPYDSPTLREWAKKLQYVDPAVFRQVQPHYVADPVGDLTGCSLEGARLVFVQGAERAVPLDLGAIALTAGPKSPAGDSGAEVDLGDIRSVVPDYDLARVRDEIMVHLDPDMGHDDWVQTGMALHHQFDGSEEALELWDTWSAGSGKWTAGGCAERWPSFNETRSAGTGAITLRWLLGLTKEARAKAAAVVARVEQQPGVGHADAAIFKLALELGEPVAEVAEAIEWSAKRFESTVRRVAFDPSRSKYTVMTRSGGLVIADKSNAAMILRQHDMDHFFDRAKLEARAAASPGCQAVAPAKRDAWIAARGGQLVGEVLALAQAHRQFDTVSAEVEMFETRGRMRLADRALALIYPHEPLREAPVDSRLIADYLQHFPQAEEFIELLVAARFASDRKNAYLWLNAESDWGKNLLLGALSAHGLCLTTSVEEIQRAASGGPVGLTLAAARRVWVLAVDEFKGIVSEVKKLDNGLEFSPKNQARVAVKLYLKMFLSAEDVPSLSGGDSGTDAQFINRFMRLSLAGKITMRPLFAQSKAAYAAALAAWVAVEVNRRVAEYLALGEGGARQRADETLARLHRAWRLVGESEGNLDDRIPEIARQFVADMTEAFGQVNDVIGVRSRTRIQQIAAEHVLQKDNVLYLRNASKAVSDWIEATHTKGEAAKIGYKKSRLLNELGVSTVHRFNGSLAKVRTLGSVVTQEDDVTEQLPL